MMKTIKKYISLWLVVAAGILVAGALSACHDEGVIMGDETDSLPHIFRPGSFTATNVGNTTTVNLSWGKVNGALSYTIEIYTMLTDEATPGEGGIFVPINLVIADLTRDNSYRIELAGDSDFIARVKANPDDPSRDSEWNSVTFSTPAENIFYGFTSDMSARGAATINWLPGMTVTRLVLTSDGATEEFSISPGEVEAGSKVVTGLDNATYKVEIFNEDVERGQFEGLLIEGDVFLSATDDFEAAFAAAAPGSVIVLAEGAAYPLRTKGAALGSTEGFRIDKDITIRGLSATNRSAFYPETAFGTALLDLGATLDNVTFKNVRICGLIGGLDKDTKSTYMINQKDVAVVENLNFLNCEIDNFNGGMRFQAPGPHSITNFIVDGTIIRDMGTGYAVMHLQNNSKADNIVIRNSTIYNIGRELIFHNTANSVGVLIENSTFNTDLDANSRYFIEYGTGFGATSGIVIRGSIFGKGIIRGVRASSATVVTIEGSLYTSDFDNTPGSDDVKITATSTAYEGASTDLFTAPAEGDFTLVDISIGEIGDPRWY